MRHWPGEKGTASSRASPASVQAAVSRQNLTCGLGNVHLKRTAAAAELRGYAFPRIARTPERKTDETFRHFHSFGILPFDSGALCPIARNRLPAPRACRAGRLDNGHYSRSADLCPFYAESGNLRSHDLVDCRESRNAQHSASRLCRRPGRDERFKGSRRNVREPERKADVECDLARL